jgi:ATP-dependent Clp protease ATP-binding subunit ClpB
MRYEKHDTPYVKNSRNNFMKITSIYETHSRYYLSLSTCTINIVTLEGKFASSQRTLDLNGQIRYSIEFGARPLKRVIVEEVENRLADRILSGKLVEHDNVTLDEKDRHFAVLKGCTDGDS